MNDLKPFGMNTDEVSWRTQNFRQSVVTKIDEAIQRSGMPTSKNSIEMENHVFQKAKSKEEYLSMVARLILHVREINTKKTMSGPNSNQGTAVMQGGPSPNQQGVPVNSQVPNQPGQGLPQGPSVNHGGGMPPDPINALQNLASQGTRNNQMINMGGPQGQLQGPQVGLVPGNSMAGMQNQMNQPGPMVSQGGSQQNAPITATNLLQTLNQRPQLANMQQLQNKMGPGMGMVSNQGQLGNNMVGPMGQMGTQMSAMQNQLGPSMGGQMGSNMSVPNSMQGPMSATNTMAGQMGPNPMGGGLAGQLGPNAMAGQLQNQMGNMTGNPMTQAQMNIMQHMQQQQQRGKPVEGMQQMMGGGGVGVVNAGGGFPGGPRNQAPNQFLRQSPSPSAPSPGMGGPSPASMGVMGGPMASPMSVGTMGVACGPQGGVASPALVPSPSAHHAVHPQQHIQQQQRSIGMAPSPSSSLNTPLGAGGAAPSPVGVGSDEHAYREKVRQLSKYIEPLRRMITRMVSDGENVEKLTKMKNLLEILSNPSKRMPLETLLKCEVVLEKLDFKRGEGMPLHTQSNALQIPGLKEHQIFNPLLEVVNNCLQSPFANHTLKRTFGPCMEALNGPEIRNMPPSFKMPKLEDPTPEIPDVLQGEIARLDSRFKVSLETMQLTGGTSAISLIAHLDDARLPCVPPMHLSVPHDYPNSAPTAKLKSRSASNTDANQGTDSFLCRVEKAMDARLARLPRSCSVGQLLDAWEMSVRQACAPQTNTTYTPVPALGM